MKKQAIHNHNPIAAYIWKSLYQELGKKGDKDLLKLVTKRWRRAQDKEICREAFGCVTVESDDITPKRR